MNRYSILKDTCDEYEENNAKDLARQQDSGDEIDRNHKVEGYTADSKVLPTHGAVTDSDYIGDCSSSLGGNPDENNPIGNQTELINNTVNLSHLQPESLFLVTVNINNKVVTALMDTGATKSLVKQRIIRESVNIDTTIVDSIVGLGQSRINTLGRASCEVTIGGLNFGENEFNVVPDESVAFDVLLGLEFCRRHNLNINVSKRIFSKVDRNNERFIFTVDEEGRVISVVLSGVSVFASRACKVSELVEVPCAIKNFVIDESTRNESTLLFEGRIASSKTRALDGLLSSRSGEFSVLISRNADTTKFPVKLKKGECLGKVSTILDIPEEDSDDDEALIDASELRKIKLGSHLSEEEEEQVYSMLLRLRDALGMADDEVGRAKVTPHEIELMDYSPIWQKPRRFAEPVNQEIEKQCEELLAMDVIEHSHSRFSSPIVPVRKKDGQLRLCIDYRRINAVTKKEKFPMPNLSDAIYATHDIKYYTKIDMVKSYYQIPLAENSRQYPAFSTAHNHFQFKTLSFGLTNSGLAFQRHMQEILADFGFKNMVIYIDDILIFNRSFEEHLSLVTKVLRALANNGIKIKASKCEFFQPEVSFLGHIVNSEGIRKSEEYIQKVRNYPIPTTITELRRFLGLVNFQNKFVPHCSEIAKPLSAVTGGPKGRKLLWTAEMTESFSLLKEELLKDVVLCHPDYSEGAEKLELFVDASGVGSGGCLMQKQRGEYRTIAYASMTFTPTQARYSTIDRELLAIRWGVKVFRPFIFGIPFVIFTDHKPLLFMNNMSHESSRHMRILTELAEYDFEIVYRPGKENTAADAMSRMMVGNESLTDELTNSNDLPRNLTVMEKVDGGGDSLFLAVVACFRELNRESEKQFPVDAQEIRREVVEYVLANKNKFSVNFNKEELRRLKNTRYAGQVPAEYIVLALSLLYKIEIRVHYGMPSPVVYRSGDPEQRLNGWTMHLQCISGIHFNPVTKVGDEGDPEVLCGNVTAAYGRENNTPGYSELEEDLEIQALFAENGQSHEPVCSGCHQDPGQGIVCLICIGGNKFCCMIDTGAQISLMKESVHSLIKKTVELNKYNYSINAIDGSQVRVKGVVTLDVSLSRAEVSRGLPFAVIGDDELPVCCLLGANFLARSGLVVDFQTNSLRSPGGDLKLEFRQPCVSASSCFDIRILMCSASQISASEAEDEEAVMRVKYTLPREKIIELQHNDYALAELRRKLINKVAVDQWKEGFLRQFRRHHAALDMRNRVLIYDTGRIQVPIVPFLLLSEIAVKTHNKLAHVGRVKLENLVSSHFWHPALGTVCRDVCTTCRRCQLFKSSSTPVSPPTIKIQARHPFDLLCIDLLQFTKSSRGNVALLVTVDHFSKFLCVVPLKNKKSVTVVRALRDQVFPKILKIPKRLLSDNGPEFKSSEFQGLMDEYNIDHVHSTSYRAAGNGAVERSNRTITDMLRGSTDNDPLSWDDRVGKMVIIYNNSVHAELKDTPTNFILLKSHSFTDNLPVPTEIVKTWKLGHPKFSPFSVGQKVAYRVPRIGNKVSNKFKEKYEGPFIVTKVQVNTVSYEITSVKSPAKCIKVHHKQIKLWHDPPPYLLPLLSDDLSEHGAADGSESGESDSSVPWYAGGAGIGLSSADLSCGSGSEEDRRVKRRMHIAATTSEDEDKCRLREDRRKREIKTRRSPKEPKLKKCEPRPLRELRCSEPVEAGRVVHVDTSIGGNVIENETAEQSQSVAGCDAGTQTGHEVKYSTPDKRCSGIGEIGISPIRRSRSCNVLSSGSENNDVIAYGLREFLGKSLKDCEKLADILAREAEGHNREELLQQTPASLGIAADYFTGFGEGSVEVALSAQSAAMSSLRSSLRNTRQVLGSYNNDTSRRMSMQLLNGRQSLGDAYESANCAEEVIRGVLPFRHTRSRGKPDSLPRVQLRTLEYKRRVSKLQPDNRGVI